MTYPLQHRASSLQQRHLRLALLAVILAVGAYFRAWHVRQPFVDAFSWRQASTAMIAENYYRTDPNILLPEVNWSGPGPNYQGREFQTVTYLASIIYRVLGQRDWIGRGIAGAFGLWGIFALYQLVRRVWDDEHATVAGATMAILPGSIFVERSFLPDPAMVALATTTVWLFVVWLQKNDFKYFVLAGIVGGWGFATKLPGLIVGLPMAYAALSSLGVRALTRPRTLRQLALLSTLMLTPVIAWYLWARHVALTYPPYHFAGEGNWLWNAGVSRWLHQGYFLPRLADHLSRWLWTPMIWMLVAIGTMLGASRLPTSQSVAVDDAVTGVRRAPLLFHWWLVAGAIFYVIGARELVDNPWNLHIVNPAAAALAALAIVRIANWCSARVSTGGKSVRWGMVALMLVVATITSRSRLLEMYTSYAQRGLALGVALERVSAPHDLVLTMASALGDPTPIYYARRRGWIFPPARNGHSWGEMPKDDRESIALLDSLRAQGASWLGVTIEQMEMLRAHPTLLAHVRSTSTPVETDSDFTIFRLHPVGLAKP
ncbi:MAG: glycosyltransferase family 39 protein [Gemmatimonadaceae bacterium]